MGPIGVVPLGLYFWPYILSPLMPVHKVLGIELYSANHADGLDIGR